MAQFDVYLNPSSKTKNIYPYFVDIQNSLLDNISSRVVIPLGLFNSFKNEVIYHLTPLVTYEDNEYLLLTQEISSIPESLLNSPIGNLKAMRNEIVGALDFLISGF